MENQLRVQWAKWVDEMAFLMAMVSKTNVHGPGTYMMNSGFLLPGFPCLGAWVSYAIGNLTDDLPTFVVLPDGKGLPYNQRGPFSSGFLPAVHQGTVIKAASPNPVPDLFAGERFKFATREADRDGPHAPTHPREDVPIDVECTGSRQYSSAGGGILKTTRFIVSGGPHGPKT